MIDGNFQELGLQLHRDKYNLSNFTSLKEFMKKMIDVHDTLSIINDNYLKSFNCIFEIITLMDEPALD